MKNNFINYEIGLDSNERKLISDAVNRVVASILKREDDPIKRRILKQCIIEETHLDVSQAFIIASLEHYRKWVKNDIKNVIL